jgi:hypothetical protein
VPRRQQRGIAQNSTSVRNVALKDRPQLLELIGVTV